MALAAVFAVVVGACGRTTGVTAKAVACSAHETFGSERGMVTNHTGAARTVTVTVRWVDANGHQVGSTDHTVDVGPHADVPFDLSATLEHSEPIGLAKTCLKPIVRNGP